MTSPFHIDGLKILAIAISMAFLLFVYVSPRWRSWVGGLLAAAAALAVLVIAGWRLAGSHKALIEAPAGSHVDVSFAGSRNTVLDATKRHAKPAEAESSPTPVAPAKPRPAWVNAPAGKSGHAYREVIVVGPYSSRGECDERLSARLEESARAYVADCLGAEAAEQVRMPVAFLREHVLLDQWEEPVQVSVGPMVQLHAQLAFDDTARREVDRLWHEAQVHERLTKTGGGAAVVLAMVAAVYFYLRLGQLAGDRQRRALHAGAAGVILVVASVFA